MGTEYSVPASRIDAVGKWFTAADPLLTPPGAATVLTCYILVPFAHFLRKASLGTNDIDNVGALTVDLMQADPGDAKAGTSVSQHDDTAMAATTDTISQLDFTLTASDEAATAAGRMYWLKIIGDDAGDGVEAPVLSICVEPVSRSTL